MKVLHNNQIIGQFRSNFKILNPKLAGRELKLVFRPLKELAGTPLYVKPFTTTQNTKEAIKHIEDILRRQGG